LILIELIKIIELKARIKFKNSIQLKISIQLILIILLYIGIAYLIYNPIKTYQHAFRKQDFEKQTIQLKGIEK